MTPKEKAKELIIKFQHPPSALQHTECDCLHIDIAKECALIAVDEILNVGFMDTNDLYDYWQEVKTEIENK
jgi:predicted DNA-binding ArsR family transcriptional regulator